MKTKAQPAKAIPVDQWEDMEELAQGYTDAELLENAARMGKHDTRAMTPARRKCMEDAFVILLNAVIGRGLSLDSIYA